MPCYEINCTNKPHDLLNESLLLYEALALSIILITKLLRGFRGIIECSVVLLVLLLRIRRSLLSVLVGRMKLFTAMNSREQEKKKNTSAF